MTAVTWSKFYWADWFSDANLRRCTLAAQGLWMNMLCISMQQEPFGYLKQGGEVLSVDDIAAMTGKKPKQTRALIAELERRQVLSRDAEGCIYSRRLVRDAASAERHRRNGVKGGNPKLINAKDRRLDNPTLNPEDKPQSPESNIPESSCPESGGPGPAHHTAPGASQVAPIVRAAEAMDTTLDALHRHTAWGVFAHTFATWLEEGCDAERDVWPTLRARTLKRGGAPASPAYFTDAVREARDRRRAGTRSTAHTLGAADLASTAHTPKPWISPDDWADRLAVFARHGEWSRSWGPKPGEPGSFAPEGREQGSAIGESGIGESGIGTGTKQTSPPPSDP